MSEFLRASNASWCSAVRFVIRPGRIPRIPSASPSVSMCAAVISSARPLVVNRSVKG